MSNAWNVTEAEYRKALEMLRDDSDGPLAEDLFQLVRFYRGGVFHRDYAERGLRVVREE